MQIECQYSVTLRLLQHNNIQSITSEHIRMSTYRFLLPAVLPTFHFQVKGAAVKLVLVGDLTSVVPCVVLLGFDDVHLKGVDLSEWHMC